VSTAASKTPKKTRKKLNVFLLYNFWLMWSRTHDPWSSPRCCWCS